MYDIVFTADTDGRKTSGRRSSSSGWGSSSSRSNSRRGGTSHRTTQRPSQTGIYIYIKYPKYSAPNINKALKKQLYTITAYNHFFNALQTLPYYLGLYLGTFYHYIFVLLLLLSSIRFINIVISLLHNYNINYYFLNTHEIAFVSASILHHVAFYIYICTVSNEKRKLRIADSEKL